MIRSAFLTVALFCLGACADPLMAARPTSATLAAHLLKDDAEKNLSPRPLEAVATANRLAVREPGSGNLLGALEIYPWSEGALFKLYAAPGQVSDIALQPGETLNSVAAGDTVRWIIGDTTSGSGVARRTHILVKPTVSGLKTNLVIATDRRVYHVEARSNVQTAMAGIAWTYPEDALIALHAGLPATPEEPAVAKDVAVEALNFDYRIEGDSPSWRPLLAFDDGRQVFIQFPPSLPQGDAPPLFITGDSGHAELVNYRIRGRYYVVDRLFGAAELRLGEHKQQIVRILRVSLSKNQEARRGS